MTTLLHIYLICNMLGGAAALITAPRLYRTLRKLREDFDSAERHGGFASAGSRLGHQRITDEGFFFEPAGRVVDIAEDEHGLSVTIEPAGSALLANTAIPETRYSRTVRAGRRLCLWSGCTDTAVPDGFYCPGHRPYMAAEALS